MCAAQRRSIAMSLDREELPLVADRLTSNRKALTCASVHSSQRITGMHVVSPPGHEPNLRADFNLSVTTHHAPVASGQHRNFESKFPDTAAHPVNDTVVMMPIQS